MLNLNQEILRDIFIKIKKVESQWSGDADKIDTNNLAKFMLAGKETFKIVLNFFAKANFADIGYRRRKYGDIDEAQAYIEDLNESSVVVGFIDSKNEYERYRFSLDFKLMKPLIVAVSEGIDELIIRDCSPPILSNIIDTLMKKDMKKVSLLRDHPKRIYDFLKQSEIKSIEICSFDEDSELSMIPESCKELQLQLYSFESFLNLKSKNLSFPSIEKLSIDGEIDYRNFVPTKIKQLVSLISSTTFPNINEINVKIEIYCDWWSHVKNMAFKLKPSMFKEIPSKIKGKFYFYGDEEEIENYHDSLPNFSNDPYMKFDSKTGYLTKSFDIHEDLVFVFEFPFPAEREASSDSDAGDSNDFDSDGDDNNPIDDNFLKEYEALHKIIFLSHTKN